MKITKKLAALLALVLALTMVFTACAPAANNDKPAADDTKPAADDTKPAADDTQPAASDEIVTINYVMHSPANFTRDADTVIPYVNEILREKVGAELNVIFIDQDVFNEKVNIMLNAGDEDVDVIAGYGSEFASNYASGSLAPLDELLEKYAPVVMEKNDPRIWDSCKRDGKIYAIPSQMPMVAANLLTWRSELVEKYEIDHYAVQTWEDLLAAADKMKAGEGEGFYPMVGTGVTSEFRNTDDLGVAVPITRSDYAFVDFVYDEGKMVAQIERDIWVEMYERNQYLYQNGYVAPDFSTRSEGNSMNEWKAGYYGITNMNEEYTDGEKGTAFSGFDCEETLLSYNEITTAQMNIVLTYIMATSQKQEKAMEVINYIWSDPFVSNTLAYGLEGQNYEVVNDDPDNYSVAPKSGDEMTYAVFHNYWGPLFDQWDSGWNSAEALKKMQEDNDSSPVSAIAGFMWDNSSVQAELAACSAVFDAHKAFRLGMVDDFDAALEAYKADLYAAGLQTIVDEAQAQYEAWLAAK